MFQESETSTTTLAEPRALHGRWRTHLLVGVALLAASGIYIAPLVFTGERLLHFDMTLAHYPNAHYYARWLSGGYFSLWSPWNAMGFPKTLETMWGFAYPPNILAFLIPADPPAVYHALVWATLFLAGLATYALCLTLELSPPGAAAGALFYVSSRYVMMKSIFLTHAVGCFYLPVFLLLIELARRGKRWAVPLMSLVTLMLVLGSQVSYVCLVHVAAGLFVLYNVVSGRARWRFLPVTLAAVAVGAAMGAFVLLPAARLALDSARRPSAAFSWSPETLARLPAGLFFPALESVPRIGFVSWCYIGLPLAAVILVSLRAAWRNPYGRFWTLLAIFAGVIALGRATPLQWLFYRIPGISYAGSHLRYQLLVSFSLAMLGAFGVDRLARSPDTSGRLARWFCRLRVAVFVCLAAFVVVHVALVVFHATIVRLGHSYVDSHVLADAGKLFSREYYFRKIEGMIGRVHWAADLRNPLVWGPLAALLASTAAFTSRRLRQRLGTIGPVLLIAIITMEFLAVASSAFDRTHDFESAKAALEMPDVINAAPGGPVRVLQWRGAQELAVAEHRLGRQPAGTEIDRLRYTLLAEMLVPMGNIEFDVESVGNHSTLMSVRQSGFLATIGAAGGLAQGTWAGLALEEQDPDARRAEFLRRLPLVAAMNVGFILSREELVHPDLDLVHSTEVAVRSGDPPENVYLYRLRSAIARWRVVPRARVVDADVQGTEIWSLMLRDEFDPRGEILIEGAAIPPTSGSPLSATGATVVPVKYDRDDPDERVFEITADGDGWFILADAWFAGWSAFVDGQQVQLVRANGVCQVVFLHKGAHTVRFLYSPTSLKIGLAVSAAALAIYAAFCTALLARAKRPSLI